MNPIFDITTPDDPNRINAENGFFNGSLYEPSNQVVFNSSIAEKVFYGENNTFIVLGRDRESDLESGNGGKGHIKCGAIDIVAGRISRAKASDLKDSKVNPSFGSDAARVYLSQKTNVDKYLNIGRFPIKDGSRACSAVAIKADDIRIVARNSLKIVTRTDAVLSNGKRPFSTMGIQLIANNDERGLQPLVLGNNLVSALASLAEQIGNIAAHAEEFVRIQTEFNAKISDHTHFSPFYGKPNSVDPKVLSEAKKAALKTFSNVEQQLISDGSNLVSWISTYLLHNNKTYINSRYNFSN